MIYLFFSIFCSASIFLIFKAFKKYHVNTFSAIVINYFIAAATGVLSLDQLPTVKELISSSWLINSFILGLFFITLFNVMAVTSQKLGPSVASIANKMALIIPVIFAVIYYGDSMSALKLFGIFLALIGVYLSIVKPKTLKNKRNLKLLFIPIILFLGSGFIDTFIKYNQEVHLEGEKDFAKLFTLLSFLTAFVLGTVVLIFDKTKRDFSRATFLGGIILGIINFGSIYFLIQTFNASSLESSVVFPINNMGVVLLTGLSSAFFFKEKFSILNIWGIALSLISILLISLAL